MKLRKAVSSDINVVTELWKDMMLLHQNYDRYFSLEEKAEKAYQKYAEENIQSGSKFFKVCLDENNDIVGYVLADIIEYPPIYPIKRFIEIIEMVIRKDQRRKGIGEIMLKDVLYWAKEKGITRVECKVAIENPISQGFWKKNGFRGYSESLVLEI
jgi:RimJ/RimL family protein N-acetyltransferase